VSTREDRLSLTFITMADTMVGDFDLVEFLSALTERCVELFDADAAGLMLADSHGNLQLMTSSSERMRLLELFELQRREGPCLVAYQTGLTVDEPDLASAGERWPVFAAEASRVGFRSASALPLRLRKRLIGAMNLFRTQPGPMDPGDLRMAQALADVAAIGLLQHRAGQESRLLAEQLGYALNNRVAIEQAKGVLAERLRIPMDRAFGLLRQYARDHDARVADVAVQVVDGALSTADLQRRPGPGTVSRPETPGPGGR
jgi:GAF domain-containing protein